MILRELDSWVPTQDGDPAALALYMRHYSCRRYKDGRARRLFVGPGEKLVLISATEDALFVWRKFLSMDVIFGRGINCAAFRNESSAQSSKLILEAEHWAQCRWPGERMYTYVNPKRVRSTNPGSCFLHAGWSKCGKTKGG